MFEEVLQVVEIDPEPFHLDIGRTCREQMLHRVARGPGQDSEGEPREAVLPTVCSHNSTLLACRPLLAAAEDD
jgi:hypothetical protein